MLRRAIIIVLEAILLVAVPSGVICAEKGKEKTLAEMDYRYLWSPEQMADWVAHLKKRIDELEKKVGELEEAVDELKKASAEKRAEE